MEPYTSKQLHELVETAPSQLSSLKPLFTIPIYIGQLQSLSISNEMIFIVDSEGVLTVLKAVFRT